MSNHRVRPLKLAFWLLLGVVVSMLLSGVEEVQSAETTLLEEDGEPIFLPLVLGAAGSQQGQPGLEPLDVPVGLVLRGPAENEIKFLNQRLRPDDLVLQALFSDQIDLTLLEQITACQKGLGLPASFEGDPSPILAEAKSRDILLVAYDLEGHLGLSIDEIVSREEAMYQVVSQHGLTFMFGTRQRAIERHYEEFVPHTDALVLQTQHYQMLSNYQAIVTNLVEDIRQTKPELMIWVQVSVNPDENPQITAEEVLEDIYQIKDVADGIFIYFEPERWEVARQVLEQIRPPK